jgi:hypothetical protein
MPVVFVRFPEATPGCTCATCEEIREAHRESKEARGAIYQWSEETAEEIGRRLRLPLEPDQLHGGFMEDQQ